MPNALKKIGVQPVYTPRQDAAERVRMAFSCGMDTDSIAYLFGLKESAVERWLHQTAKGNQP